MWSAARVDLGLGSDEFWRLAPRQYVALLRRSRERRIRDIEYGPALVTCALIQLIDRPKKPPRIRDFMPSLATPPKQKTVEEMMSLARAMTIAKGGRVGGHYGS